MSRFVVKNTLPEGQTVGLYHGDLTKEEVDAIVNAGNSQLAHGGGVAGAIVSRGGKTIQDESSDWVRQHGPVTCDTPAITGAGQLPSRFVIHVVGPVWGEGDEDEKLSKAVTGALLMASDRGFQTIALPAISTGIFGFPKERGAHVILKAIQAFFDTRADTSLSEVRIVLIDEPSVEIFAEEFSRRWSDESP